MITIDAKELMDIPRKLRRLSTDISPSEITKDTTKRVGSTMSRNATKLVGEGIRQTAKTKAEQDVAATLADSVTTYHGRKNGEIRLTSELTVPKAKKQNKKLSPFDFDYARVKNLLEVPIAEWASGKDTDIKKEQTPTDYDIKDEEGMAGFVAHLIGVIAKDPKHWFEGEHRDDGLKAYMDKHYPVELAILISGEQTTMVGELHEDQTKKMFEEGAKAAGEEVGSMMSHFASETVEITGSFALK